ncbi:Alpha-10 giardin [Giardia muris]|uniref:Alpha-10 giardin n=1 Tax=Giardia muris TaxID=5742 RepID=A0A142C640_GIAMU|nr:alpha-10 giardin [Giardia muris]TNJ29451.1 Alpha-10 giardin [Giardia muris]|eukprot:TNJ29451.1 Alpha-10 giardin [Giardia muris]
MPDYGRVADDLCAILQESRDEDLVKLTARYKMAERREISTAYQGVHGKIVSDAIRIHLKKGPLQTLMALAWETYPDIKASQLQTLVRGKNPKALCDIILTTNPDEWDCLITCYQCLSGRDLETDLRDSLSPKFFWSRLCLSWIAFRRTPRNDPSGDAAALQRALEGKKPDEDTIIRLLGTSTPDEWARISKAFEVAVSRTVHDVMADTFKGVDLSAAHTAHHFLNNANEGAAYLIFRAVNDKGDAERCARTTAFYYDKCPHVKLNYAIFGNLARDLRRAFKGPFAEACCMMWGVL